MNFKNLKEKYEKVPVEHYPHNVDSNPVVSVCVQTYNHEPYIKDCLDGILMQETDFPIEILLGEDASKDGTREICIEYAIKHPVKIKLFLHSRENNIKIGGQPTGRFNFLYNLYSAKGKYIAFCEGDDYWTNPLKLQKQVDKIEKGNYGGVSHNSLIKYEYDTQIQSRSFLKDNIGNQIFRAKDLVKQRKFHTASLLFKKSCIENIKFPKITSADRFIFSLIACQGCIYYIDEIMCCYRKNSGGISRNVTVEMMKRDLKMPHSLNKLNADYPVYKSLSFIHHTIVMYSFDASIYDIIKHSFLFLFYSFAEFPNNLRSILVFLIKGLPKKIIKSK